MKVVMESLVIYFCGPAGAKRCIPSILFLLTNKNVANVFY